LQGDASVVHMPLHIMSRI